MSVRERFREMGILKSLGYTNHLILALVLSEAVATSFLGGLIGVGLAYTLFTRLSITISLFSLSISPALAIKVGSLSIIIGFLGGIIPALQAANLQPAEAMQIIT